MIKLTNDILTKRQSSLDEDSKTVQQIAKSYFKITEKIQKLAQTTKFPDVIKLANGLANELIYETGKIFSQEKPSVSLDVKPDKMDEFSVAYPPNAIICKMGEAGKDMYILNSGRIAVLIQDKQVAEINIRGTVIGEIALLLGETRSATLKAIDQVSLSVVKKDNLEDFHSHHEDLFLQIGVTLSQRIHNNIQQIRNIDKQLEEKKDEKVAGFLTREKAVQYLKKLYKETLDLYDTKEYEQLSELIDQARTSMEKFEK
jgi:CRP-like cAMP-binding protein